MALIDRWVLMERHRDVRRRAAALRLSGARREVEVALAARCEASRLLQACRAWHEALQTSPSSGEGQGLREALLVSCAALLAQRRRACERAEARLQWAHEAVSRCRSEWARCERASLRLAEWRSRERRQRMRQVEANAELEALDERGRGAPSSTSEAIG